MSTIARSLQAGAAFVVGLNAGIVLTTPLTPTLSSAEGDLYVPYWTALTADYSRSGPVIGTVGMLLAAGASIAWFLNSRRSQGDAVGRSRRHALVDMVALILLIATGVIVVVLQTPLNVAAQGWSLDNLPSNWKDVRDVWMLQHNVRTTLTVVAFALLLAPMLEGRARRAHEGESTTAKEASSAARVASATAGSRA